MSTTQTKKSQGTPAAPATEPTALVPVPPAALPATLLDQYKDAVAGSQKEAAAMTQQDFSMPFLAIVQSLSPQRQKADPKYIEGAEEGDIFNTVTSELFKAADGIQVVLVKYELVYNIWRPREMGGGFLGSFQTQAEAVEMATSYVMQEVAGVTDRAQAAKIALQRGKEGWIRDTMNQYLLVRGLDGTWSPALLSLTSTKLTPGRKWNTIVSMEKPSAGRAAVRWNKVWHVTTIQQKNQEGQPFFNLLVPRSIGETDPTLWQQAAEFFTMLKTGFVKVEYEKAEETEAGGEAEGEGQQKF